MYKLAVPLSFRLAEYCMIANHFIYEFCGKKLSACLSRQRAEFNDIHSNDGGAAADLFEKVQELVPAQSTGFGRANGGHFGGIERVQVNRHIGMSAQAF